MEDATARWKEAVLRWKCCPWSRDVRRKVQHSLSPGVRVDESDCLCSKQSASDWLKIWSSNWKVIKMRTGFVNKVPLPYQEQCVVALKSWVLIKFCICGFIYSFMSNCNLTALLLEALAGDQKDLIKDCWAVFFLILLLPYWYFYYFSLWCLTMHMLCVVHY